MSKEEHPALKRFVIAAVVFLVIRYGLVKLLLEKPMDLKEAGVMSLCYGLAVLVRPAALQYF